MEAVMVSGSFIAMRTMLELLADIPRESAFDIRQRKDPDENITFLEGLKR